MEIRPVVLEGRVVRLEPLSMDHHAALCEVGLDPQLWRWTHSLVRTNEEMARYIQATLDAQAQGRELPFATCERASGRVVGSTRFGNIDRANRRVEIGWTWIAGPWQRTAVNTEAKYLMLRHAFEQWGCVRVELKTDVLNEASRRAILRLGAKEEGLLRQHMITATGRLRDTVYYSILDGGRPGQGRGDQAGRDARRGQAARRRDPGDADQRREGPPVAGGRSGGDRRRVLPGVHHRPPGPAHGCDRVGSRRHRHRGGGPLHPRQDRPRHRRSVFWISPLSGPATRPPTRAGRLIAV